MIRPRGYNKYIINNEPFGGPIYTTDISINDKYKILTKYMNVKKSKAERLKRGNCPHSPKCFINYGST